MSHVNKTTSNHIQICKVDWFWWVYMYTDIPPVATPLQQATNWEWYMTYLKAPVAMTLGVYTSRSFIDCNLFQMEWFVVAWFLLTSASRGPTAIAELLVIDTCRRLQADLNWTEPDSIKCPVQSSLVQTSDDSEMKWDEWRSHHVNTPRSRGRRVICSVISWVRETGSTDDEEEDKCSLNHSPRSAVLQRNRCCFQLCGFA